MYNPAFQRGISAIETKRKHKAPWFYKQATNLDKQRVEVQEAIQNIGGLNTPKKREAAIKILNKWFANEEKHSVELNRINKDINTLENELGDTQDTVTRQSTKIIELLADNNAVSQTAKKQEKLLRKISQKVLQLREKNFWNIIKGLNER